MAVNLDELPLPDELPALPDGWRYESLGDLVEERGVSYGIVQPGSETTDGVPIVRVNNIRNGRIDTTDMLKVEAGIEAKFHRSRLRGGEVLLTLVGTLGEVAVVPDHFRGWNVARAVGVIPVREDPGSLWLSICLRSTFIQHCIRTWATTTVQATFNLRDLTKLPIPIPPTDTREAIAGVLGALDDKIELNRRMNVTLEAMARALFQSWFVDFDPVRAKLDGRQPPHIDPATAALFPDSFQESPIGHIPTSWKVESVSDVMTFEGGTQPPASEFIDEPREGYVRLVQIRDFYTSGHVTFVPDTKKLRKFTTDDLMLARYGSSGNAAKGSDSLGRVCRGMSGAYNVALVKVVPLRPLREFLFCYLKSDAFQGTIKGMGARSVQSGFRKEDLEVIFLVTAPPQVHEAFERFAVDVWRKTYANDRESRTLATLRDTLLPKLLSGELRVPDVSRYVEEAGLRGDVQ